MQYLLILLLSLSIFSIDAQAAKGGRWADENTDSGSDSVKSKGKRKNRQTDVVDTTAPVLTVPADIQVSVNSPNGTAVVFSASAYDNEDGSVEALCAPASGSIFPIGTTQVACVAVDSAENTASAAFVVTVEDTSPPMVNSTPPLVAFLSPTNNAILQVGDALSITVNASDSDGSIQFCRLYHNQNLVRQDDHAPYEWGQDALDTPLLNLQEGVSVFTASCTDNDNLESSASITLLVEAIPEPEVADVLLDWVAPTTREDGSPLPVGDIDSYEIYYYTTGNSHAGTSLCVPSQNATGNLITSHQISAVAGGSYYFSIATVDTGGNVSAFVEPVNLVIP